MDRVLIVDDDTQLLAILTEGLSQYRNKFEIITAQDGLAAIIALKKQPVSLVVTDIRMPIVNGLVLLAFMSKNYPKTPCIVMTGFGTPFLQKRLKHETAFYIEKPFRVKELGKAILVALGQQETLAGAMTGISVAGFAQLIEMERTTCLCEVTTPHGEKGYLLFEKGILHNALFGDYRGEKAALALLETKGAKIRFRKPPKEKIARRIATPLSSLLAKVVARQESEGSERAGFMMQRSTRNGD